MTTEHLDVLIVGAGLSGIGAGHAIQTHCKGKRYAILEGRDAIGGTWRFAPAARTPRGRCAPTSRRAM